MMMRYYVTVSKSHFSISGFVQIQPENIRKSKANMIIHYSSVARSEDPLICLLLLRENRYALVNFRLACNMMWGGAHSGTDVLWLIMAAYQPWKTLCARAWARMYDSSHARPMLWYNQRRECAHPISSLHTSLCYIYTMCCLVMVSKSSCVSPKNHEFFKAGYIHWHKPQCSKYYD